MSQEDILKDFVEVDILCPDNFLIIKESLTRIGLKNYVTNSEENEKSLLQMCHILYKNHKYYIVHYKELFKLDDREVVINNEDIAIRNTIVNILKNWDLVDIKHLDKIVSPVASMSDLTVLKFSEKKNWKLTSRYNLGKKSKNVKNFQPNNRIYDSGWTEKFRT